MAYSNGTYTPTLIPTYDPRIGNTPQSQYQANPGILSVESDTVRFDPLDADRLKGDYDATSKASSRRVATNYKQYGNLALLPEQAAGLNQELESYKAEDASAFSRLKGYREEFSKNLTARDQSEASGIANAQKAIEDAVSKIKGGEINGPSGSSGINMTTVRVVNGGTIEASYQVPQAVADALASDHNLWANQTPEGFNVDVKVRGGHIMGQEIHEALADAQAQTAAAIASRQGLIDSAVAAARAQQEAQIAQAKEDTRRIQYSSLDRQISQSRAERNIASYDFEQDYAQAYKQYQAIGRQWADRLSNLRSEQSKARGQTAQGIKELSKSGILNYSVQRG